MSVLTDATAAMTAIATPTVDARRTKVRVVVARSAVLNMCCPLVGLRVGVLEQASAEVNYAIPQLMPLAFTHRARCGGRDQRAGPPPPAPAGSPAERCRAAEHHGRAGHTGGHRVRCAAGRGRAHRLHPEQAAGRAGVHRLRADQEGVLRQTAAYL